MRVEKESRILPNMPVFHVVRVVGITSPACSSQVLAWLASG